MKGTTILDCAFRVCDAKSEAKRLLLPSPSSQCQAYSNANTLKSSSKCRKLGPRISDTVKRKLRLGAKIIKVGGVEKLFRRAFNFREGEEMLKASPCYLSTTIGPIAGLLFISTDKVAFCSDRSIKYTNPTSGETLRFHYKVVIPLGKVKRASQSASVKRPSEKYLDVVTIDGFEFWFMGIVNYERTFECLKHAICQGCE